jgi:hypothetical protein
MKAISIVVALLGIAAIVIGAVFVGLGMSRNSELTQAMRQEKVSLGIEQSEAQAGQVIDSLGEALKAGDTIREHRRSIAPSYSDLLAGGQYDPTNPRQLTYSQAMNLENYLYLAVVAFGLTQAVMGSGAFMVLTGLALVGTGVVLYRVTQKL